MIAFRGGYFEPCLCFAPLFFFIILVICHDLGSITHWYRLICPPPTKLFLSRVGWGYDFFLATLLVNVFVSFLILVLYCTHQGKKYACKKIRKLCYCMSMKYEVWKESRIRFTKVSKNWQDFVAKLLEVLPNRSFVQKVFGLKGFVSKRAFVQRSFAQRSFVRKIFCPIGLFCLIENSFFF